MGNIYNGEACKIKSINLVSNINVVCDIRYANNFSKMGV